MNYIYILYEKFQLLVGIGLILIITLVIHFIYAYSLRLYAKGSKKRSWIEILVHAVKAPGKWVIWSMGVIFCLEWSSGVNENIHDLVPLSILVHIRNVLLILFFTWMLLRAKTSWVKYLKIAAKSNSKIPVDLLGAIAKLLTLMIWITAVLVTLSILNVPLQALLTFGGVGTLAFSWAAKDFIANLFGGLMIHLNRPFAVNDWIYSPNKNFEGTVEEIGWYMTRIRTFERRPTYIPNGLMTDAIIQNPGRMYNRRIKANVGLRYDDIKQVKPITEAIEAMLKEHPDIAKDQIIMVHLLEFGDSALTLNVYCFLTTTVWKEYRISQQDIFLKIAEIIEDHGAEIAFPTRTVHFFNHSDHSDYKE